MEPPNVFSRSAGTHHGGCPEAEADKAGRRVSADPVPQGQDRVLIDEPTR